MKRYLSALALLALAGCSGAPEPPQEVAAPVMAAPKMAATPKATPTYTSYPVMAHHHHHKSMMMPEPIMPMPVPDPDEIEYAGLKTGHIAFNPPTDMKVGTTHRIVVEIGTNNVPLAVRAFPTDEPGVESSIQKQVIPVGAKMRATLTGYPSQWSILPVAGDAIQPIRNPYTSWVYDVSPLVPGRDNLTLSVDFIGAHWNRNVTVLDRQITVTVSERDWWAAAWSWFLDSWSKLGIVALFGLWLAGRRKAK